MKIVASLVILGLCANVAFGATVAIAGTSQGSAFTGLNSTAQKVYTAANSTDAANWNPTVVDTTAGTDPSGIPFSNVIFGPGATNDTSYVYGYSTTTASSQVSITTLVVRTLNNTIVAYGNDSTNVQPFTKSTTKTSPSILATEVTYAVAPGYLAFLTYGTDSTSNQQVYYTLVSGSTATPVKVTSITDVVAGTSLTAGQFCTSTTVGLGNIWYDQGSKAFFYTYWVSKATDATAATASGGTGTCGGSPATVNTIYVSGVYLNGTAAITTPLALATVTPANDISNLVSGPDNYLNATNIYVVYKDADKSTGGANSAEGVIYQQKIAKSASATAGTFSALVSDTITGTISGSTASTSVVTVTNTPLSVWASNFTYGIAIANKTETQTSTQYPSTTGTVVYTVSNYLNSTLTWADSGITYSSATAVGALYGWQLNTGYTLVASWLSSSTSTPQYTIAYTWGTFYANGTVNATASTLGSVQGPVSFYEDVNGTNWIGWTDVETANTAETMTYAGYLGKLQGQLNVPSGASILSAISAFFALFLAAIFVF